MKKTTCPIVNIHADRRWQAKKRLCAKSKVPAARCQIAKIKIDTFNVQWIVENFTHMYIWSSLFSLQFNISIQDLPDVLAETKKELQVSQSDANITSRLPLCVEISLQTVDNDRMTLEVWSLNVNTDLSDPQIKASYTVYNRMSILLKSLLSITRVTPAYKLSRRQSPESYCIYYKIYSGEPIINLGELTTSLYFCCIPSEIPTLWREIAALFFDWDPPPTEKMCNWSSPSCTAQSRAMKFNLAFDRERISQWKIV